MPTTTTEFWWTLIIGTSVFLSLSIGLIAAIVYSQRRYVSAQEEKFAILKESEERFRHLVEETPVPTIVSRNGVISYVNAAVLSLLKTTMANDVLGKALSEFLHPDTPMSVRKRVEQITGRGELLPPAEMKMVCVNKTNIDVETAAISITYNDKPASLIVLRDITLTKQAALALREIPKKIIAAQEAERRRFARELHDGVNQILFNVKGKVETLEKKIIPHLNNGATNLSPIIDPLMTVMKEIQRISRNLRPSALDDLGLSAAIASVTEEFTQRTHIRISVQGFPQKRLLPDLELAFFRIIQEALNNIEKHSMATQVVITCAGEENSLQVTISDNGKGVQKERLAAQLLNSGIGLTTMRERAELVGGTLTFTSVPDKGTTIVVTVPANNSEAPSLAR